MPIYPFCRVVKSYKFSKRVGCGFSYDKVSAEVVEHLATFTTLYLCVFSNK